MRWKLSSVCFSPWQRIGANHFAMPLRFTDKNVLLNVYSAVRFLLELSDVYTWITLQCSKRYIFSRWSIANLRMQRIDNESFTVGRSRQLNANYKVTNLLESSFFSRSSERESSADEWIFPIVLFHVLPAIICHWRVCVYFCCFFLIKMQYHSFTIIIAMLIQRFG